MKKTKAIKWLSEPEEHNYTAAESYLRLTFTPQESRLIILALEDARIESFKSKDIFRASKLSLLGISNSHVEKNLKKIEKGKKLSPILLYRDTIHRTLIIADGYHRMCAVYLHNEDAEIPCKII